MVSERFTGTPIAHSYKETTPRLGVHLHCACRNIVNWEQVATNFETAQKGEVVTF